MCSETDNLKGVRCKVQNRIWMDQQSATLVFKSILTNKATGSDNMSAFLLKTFAEEVTPM